MILRMRTITASYILVFAALAATPARAECQCLANGHIFHHGEIACLQLPSGPELAQCDMVLNISPWKKIQDGCPEATAPFGLPVKGDEQKPGEGGDKANDLALSTANARS
ncbi:hypothetical protein [Mesorhizobium sp. M0571]|uniref:hypothetical protein n=1 Tax=Mesorhizobium sp. M0571 TaxID=2956960 RepID=UPI0033357954